VEWVDLAQDREKWRNLVKLRVSYNAGNLLTR
jgi:hypothetical protein